MQLLYNSTELFMLYRKTHLKYNQVKEQHAGNLRKLVNNDLKKGSPYNKKTVFLLLALIFNYNNNHKNNNNNYSHV